MEKEYVSHPIYINYEASRDGTIRHRNRGKSVGVVKNAGYLQVNVSNEQQKQKISRS